MYVWTYLTNIADWSYIAGVINHGLWKICDGRNNVKPIDIPTNNNGSRIWDRNTFQFRFVWWKRFINNDWNWWKYNFRPVILVGFVVKWVRVVFDIVGNCALLPLIVETPLEKKKKF